MYVCILYRGRNPLHILGQYGKENAAAIFELFIECMPEYDIDKVDGLANSRTSFNSFINEHFIVPTPLRR